MLVSNHNKVVHENKSEQVSFEQVYENKTNKQPEDSNQLYFSWYDSLETTSPTEVNM